ncbi:MAG: family 16 glycosylhydrolase, partial [Salinivirgaceae bacterium]|nr:family 16 glycosylhydrolase [Salinivirgaceae bacterium]
MANFSFALRLAFGLLPKTEKIESDRNQLIAEYNKLNEFKDSETLKKFNKLQEYVDSAEFKSTKSKITSLNYADSEYCSKEKQFQALEKDKRVKNYFSVSQSADLKRFEAAANSDALKRLKELAETVNSADFQQAKSDKSNPEKMAECKSLQQEYKSLTKNPEIKFWTKYQNKSAYKMYVETSNSTLIADYEELKTYVNSDEFKTQKEYLLDKNRFSRSEEAKREQEYIAMKNSEEIKWYEATVNSNKFDELKAWNLTFEDDFTDGKVDESKWMNSFFMGKMMLNDRYVLANEKQYFTDNKNVDIKNSILSIVTKKEKATGKVWDEKLGFMTKDFDYTSGMLSTANSFRQQYGRFEAKIKINSEAPVYQAFWLKGEHKEPEIDIFKYNIKKGQMQLSAYNKGAAAGNKFGGS